MIGDFMEKRICIGKISTAHGVKGLVKIVPFCEDVNLLNGKVFTEESGDKTLEISLKNPIGKYFLAEIKGIDTREKAETLKCSLFVSRETLPEIDNEDEFYIEDLIGLTAKDADGQVLGIIKTVDNYGAGDLLEIMPQGGQTYYVPFHDDFVTNVDIVAKIITIENAQHFIPE